MIHASRIRHPRRARRGLAALGAVMVLAGLAATLVTGWQVAMAGERIRGAAGQLSSAVAAEGYGLHHWLHEERTDPPVTPAMTFPAEGTARALTAAEAGRLAAHSATARWRRTAADATVPVMPRGWRIVHLVGTAGDHADGVLVLRPSDDLVASPAWGAVRRALDVTLGASEAGAVTLAAAVVVGWDDDRDRAFLASRFARLDRDAVLREDHAGHPRRTMEADVLMGGNDLGGVARLQAERATIPRIDGDCRPPDPPPGTLITDTLCAGSLALSDTLTANARATISAAAAQDVNVTRDVTAITWIRTGDLVVSGMVTTPAVTACADPDADICGGGDLDLEVGTGTPDWTEAAIFGDVVIRNGNRLTGVTRTTGGIGVFGTLGNGTLNVGGCMRSVYPFIHHGGGC